MKQKFNVTGMTCSACSAHVEKAVSRLDGVQKAEVSLMTNSMTVQYDEDVLSPGGIIDAVIHAGYGASLPETAAVKAAAARPEARLEEELSAMKHRLIWSFVFLVPLFYISMGHMMGAPLPSFLLGMENAVAFGLTQLLLTLPIMYLNDKYCQVGFQTLLHRAPNMDSLIAVGSAAAMSLSSVCVVSNALRLRFFKSKFKSVAPPEQSPCQGSCPVDITTELPEEHKEEKTMTKTLNIEGMMCAHCVAHVEKALSALGGVTAAKADLEGKCATVTLAAPVSDQELKDAVTEAGYEVVSIQ